MKIKSQITFFFSVSAQIVFMLAVFICVGLLLPMRIAPTVFEWLPITTPMEASQSQLSFQITNRNLTSGETVTVAVSDPQSSANITSITYECVAESVTLAYERDGEMKELPCATSIQLPARARHEFTVMTTLSDPAYIPLDFSVEQKEGVRNLSVVIAAGANVDTVSKLTDEQNGTLQ